VKRRILRNRGGYHKNTQKRNGKKITDPTYLQAMKGKKEGPTMRSKFDRHGILAESVRKKREGEHIENWRFSSVQRGRKEPTIYRVLKRVIARKFQSG